MKRSAGLLMYRRAPLGLEVLLGHPGGPLFARLDDGAWSVPKGWIEPGEEPIAAARREFTEETGFDPGEVPLLDLGQVRQSSGKIVYAWAFAGDVDLASLHSNPCTIEWPRGTGRYVTFPELDRFEYFDLAAARRKLIPAHTAFLDRLAAAVNES